MTKADKTRQETDLRSLSVRQRNAIDLLVLGQADGEVAEAVGVTRQTVCGWRRYHPAFQAELNLQRKAVWGSSADRLRSMLPRALDNLEEALAGPDGVKMSLQVVKMCGLGKDGLAPSGYTNAEQIITNRASAEEMELLSSALTVTGGTGPTEDRLVRLLEDLQVGE